jgi:nucleoside-diphosphate-sugar epimerase
MNIIIGSEGFLGSYLCKIFDNIIKVNSKRYDNFINTFNYNNTNIFICADVKNNTKIINDLIKLNMNNNYILFSSAAIYYNINKIVYSESDINNTKIYNINNTKTSEKTSNYYVDTLKLNEELFSQLLGKKKIIRLGTLYGSSPNLNASRGIHRMIYFPLINNYIEIYDKKINKSLTSFEDLNTGLKYIMNNNDLDLDIYNLSSFDITIEDLAKYISNKFNIEIKEIDMPNNTNNYNFILNTTKLKKLGWEPKGNITNLIENITNNFTNINKINYDKINIYYKKQECRVCESKNLVNILNLNNQPPPNRLDDLFWELLNVPLKLNLCTNCFHLQLESVLNPIIMYKNYSYLSGTSNTMKEYFRQFAKSLNITNKKVLDIACNDCALLDCFKELNNETYGIDPAENIVTNINNHNIYCGFFNKDAVNYFNNKFNNKFNNYFTNKFNVITAFNVFAHVDDIYDFLNNLYEISDETTDIYIQTSQCNMIQNNEFDTVYHEHLSFFNLNSMKYCLQKSNFILFDTKIVDVHGSSYLFHIKQKNNLVGIKNNDETNSSRLLFETNSGIYKLDTYFNYSENIYKWKNDLINLLKNKKNLVGVGASAKGITILNFINNDLINNNIIID